MSRTKSSRERYNEFRQAFRSGTLDELVEQAKDTPASSEEKAEAKTRRRQYVREYARWLWPSRYAIAMVFLLSMVGAGLELLQPLFMRFMIDDILLIEGLSDADRLLRLNLAGGILFGVIMLAQVLDVAKNYRQQQLNVRVVLSIRRSLFDKLLHLPLEKLSNMKTGGILSRLTGDVDTTTGMLQLAVVSPGVSVVRLVLAVVLLFVLNWRLALTAIGIIPGIMLVSLIVAKRIRPIHRSVRKDVEHVDARVSETFSGIRVVRAFRREPLELLTYLIGRHTVLRKELFAHRRELILWASWGVLLAGVNLVILWFGGYLQVMGRATVGDIMAFQWYTFLLLNPVWQIVNSFSELQRSLAAMERVFEVLGMSHDKPDQPEAQAAPRQVEEIRFDNVWFEYNDGDPVVSEFDVTVPGGTVVALVGRSGAGKTTVTDIVARFHDPTRGRLLLNGTDARDFRLKSYRDLLAVVQQETFLFDGSVRDNIAYGRPEATDAEIESAAQRANAHEFIAQLPDQYESLIGERGVKLSGGQGQRLAIARAILADPQILILDEATSNLDTESEQLIQASLQDLLAGRTTFVIAHRLSTIRRADLILVMEEGRIIERGSHDELMARQGTYFKMVERQRTSPDGEDSGFWQ